MKRVLTEAGVVTIGLGMAIVLAPAAVVIFCACAKLDLERWIAKRKARHVQ